MSGASTDGGDADVSAAEYVIGLLEPHEAREVEARAIGDPALARAILEWQQALHPLTRVVRPVKAPDDVWRRLERTLGLEAARAPVPLAVLASPPVVRRAKRVPLHWGSAATWRGGLIGAACAASVALAYIASCQWVSPPGVAALTASGGAEPAYAVMLTKDGLATVIAVNPDYPNGGALQLWTLDGATPVSLGLLPRQGRFRIERRLVPGAKLLISREPLGGSPQNAPTGPVVYQGNLIRG